MTSISAVICTYNRAAYLRQALRSLAGQTLPVDQYEVVVIDNACTDDTAAVIEEFRRLMPNLVHSHETQLGLSYARNRGALVARGEYIAYLDDDARAEPQWLHAVLEAFQAIQPSPMAIAGPVHLDWSGCVPDWLPERYWSLYTFVDHGREGRFLRDHEHLVGANMAFCRAILLSCGAFDVALGRRGGLLLSGEEAAVVKRLRQANLPIYYEPTALVWHAVPPERHRRRWLFRRLFWDGASQPLMALSQLSGQNEQYRPGYEAYIDIRRCGRFSLETVRNVALGRFAQAQDSLFLLVQRLGRLRTHLALWLGRST